MEHAPVTCIRVYSGGKLWWVTGAQSRIASKKFLASQIFEIPKPLRTFSRNLSARVSRHPTSGEKANQSALGKISGLGYGYSN